jgi:tryptophan synthase alpha chain
MSRIEDVFSVKGHKALIAYLTVGYPSVETTLQVVPMLAEAGCDIVELGIPFSDPLADGTTIQEASLHALQAGVTMKTCLETATGIRRKVDLPLAFMTYYNPVLHYGLEAFCTDCVEVGVEGLIVPDLPPDEAAELDVAARKRGIDLIYLLTPASTPERVQLVTTASRGFVYLVSLLGVTGARNSLPTGFEGFVSRVRRETSKPLCVGFGIGSADQARRVAQVADGVIIGSRLVELIREDTLPFDNVRAFIGELRSALDR